MGENAARFGRGQCVCQVPSGKPLLPGEGDSPPQSHQKPLSYSILFSSLSLWGATMVRGPDGKVCPEQMKYPLFLLLSFSEENLDGRGHSFEHRAVLRWEAGLWEGMFLFA